MEPTQKSEEEVAQGIYQYAADLFKKGKSSDDVCKSLIEFGLSVESAENVTSTIARQRTEIRREKGRKNSRHGAWWFIGGLIVTALTYSTTPKGEPYFVAWGAIVVGAIQLIVGLIQRSSGKE